MPGAPSGRGCEGCRKRKKKCDLVQPSCSRCLRYGIRCIGSGQRVFRFKNATITESTPVSRTARPRAQPPVHAHPRPQRPLGNELTSTAGAFISTLQISDRKFSIQGFGPFLMDVPRRLGRSAILSASAKAFSSAVTAVYTGKTVFQALKDYGAALTCMRNAFASDPGQAAKADTLCGIYLLLLSQNFIRGHNDDTLVHMQGLLHVLNNMSPRDRSDPFASQIIDLITLVAITESIIDPRVIISDLKLDLKQTNFYGPVNDYSVVDIRSTNLTVANLIVLPTYLREPEHHLGRLRASYDLMRLESKKLVSITVQLHAACEASNDWAYYKGYVICESTEHADHAANEVLAAGRRAWSFRPLGTTYMPKTLCLMWATVDNPNTKARLENMIDSYRENFRGNSWTKLVHFFEQRFEAMRRRAQSRIPYRFRLDTASPGSTNAGSEESV